MNKRTSTYVAALLIVVAALGVVVGRQTGPSPTTTTIVAQPSAAVWPFATGPMRFTDPSTAAYSFAVNYVGFNRPIVGTFQRGDARSGEVPVRATANGPVTTVLVRQFGADNTWWVLGAVSAAIEVTSPKVLAAVSSPMALSGRSSAFEAIVNVDLRGDASLVSVARTTVRGGSMGVMGPFAKSLRFSSPSAPAGALMLRTFSAKDGSVVEANVLRVFFAH